MPSLDDMRRAVVDGEVDVARDLANAACEKIHFDGAYYRRDIGDRVLVQS